MSVRYRNERNGDEIERPAPDKRLEALANWHRLTAEPTAAQEEPTAPAEAPAGAAPSEPAKPKPKPRRKPAKAKAKATSPAPESAQHETPEPPASEAEPL